MSDKSETIKAILARFSGGSLDPRYAAYFDCFKRELFYEAHDVLEPLWLAERGGVDGDFYKGLIQLAGAFVHLQKGRPGPAASLFKLARVNLAKYPGEHLQLDVASVSRQTRAWIQSVEGARSGGDALRSNPLPKLDFCVTAR